MRTGSFALTCVAAVTICGGAAADPYRAYGADVAPPAYGYNVAPPVYGYEVPREYKQDCDGGECRQEFRTSRCKVERHWDRDGHYSQEVQCDRW